MKASGMARAITLLAGMLGMAWTSVACAVPAYSRQTGQECAACHMGAYGPQLTPYGVRFKLGGYVDSDEQGGKLPLSAALIASFTHTAENQARAPTASTKVNDNAVIDQASLYVAGRLAANLGTFTQITYDGAERKAMLDMLDLRYASSLDLSGKELVLGLVLDNNPTLQDPFNSSPAWSFPYVQSSVAFEPGAATLINGGLEQRVLGLSGYLFWNKSLYVELGSYRSLSPAVQARLGLGREEDPGRLGSGTLYWRIAWTRDYKRHAFHVGAIGLNASLQPDRGQPARNDYRDVGLDAGYEYLGNRRHMVSVYASYIHERQTRGALLASGGAARLHGRVDEFKLALSYDLRETWDATLARFDERGSRDAMLYGDGYTGGRPDTAGTIAQVDWTPWGKEGSWHEPWANLRLGLQYTRYDRFNGARRNYDGQGRNARDNDTWLLFLEAAL